MEGRHFAATRISTTQKLAQMKMHLHPIGQLISNACKKNGITATKVCEKAGISRETLYRVMRGEGEKVSVAKICAVARATKLAPLMLLRLIHDDLAKGAATLLPTLIAGDCSAFIADVTIPDGHTVMVAQRFTKTWELQNIGTVPWVARHLQCIDSDLVTTRWQTPADGGARVLVPLDTPWLTPDAWRVAVPDTAVGENVKVSVTFTAPAQACDTISRWKMVTADGDLCYPQHVGLSCAVSVVAI